MRAMRQNHRMLPTLPLRSITDDEVETFWRDGVVCLRQAMPATWLEHMVVPVEASLVKIGRAHV